MPATVANAHEMTDAFMARAISLSAEQGRAVRCAMGCFHCCREPVYVEKSEVQHIIDALSPEQLEALKERTRAWLEKFRSSGLHKTRKERVRSGSTDSTQDYSRLLRYRAQNLWCPLLKDGLCSTYANRPLGCRTHAAIGHPAKCEQDDKRPKQVFLVTPSWPAEILGALSGDAPGSLYEFDHLGVWLSILLLGESEQSAAAESYFVRQTDPE